MKNMQKACEIAEILEKAGATDVFLVGGCVRDEIMGTDPKDIDIEVYGLTYDQVVQSLELAGFAPNLVGKSFAVVKIGNVDISLPRTDEKVGQLHKDFIVRSNPFMRPEQACLRRDFTMNAIMKSLGSKSKNEIFDPLGGIDAIKNGRIISCSWQSMQEDPLRVLRAAQFIARFDLDYSSFFRNDCQRATGLFSTISVERIWEELWKMCQKGEQIGKAIWFLFNANWLHHFPIWKNLMFIPQDSEWHPEGDAFHHALASADAAVQIAKRRNFSAEDQGILVLVALLHDAGKADTSDRVHSESGAELARAFLMDLHAPLHIVAIIETLVREHMTVASFGNSVPPTRVVRRLVQRLNGVKFDLWAALTEADYSGRPPLPPCNPAQSWEDVAKEIEIVDNKIQPILMGKHLLEHKLCNPGPQMGQLLKAAYEAQLNEEFSNLEQAVQWAADYLACSN